MVGSALLLQMLHCSIAKGLHQATTSYNKEQRSKKRKHLLKKVSKPKESSSCKTCRVCLKPGNIPILGDRNHSNISEELNFFGGINITSDDIYPKYICSTCQSLLEGAILLRKTAQESDTNLKKSANRNLRKFQEIKTVVKPRKRKVKPVVKLNKTASDTDDDDDDVNYLLYGMDLSPDSPQNKMKPDDDDSKKPVNEKSVFTCERCQLIFENNEKFQEHLLSDDHDKKKIKCHICNQEYSYVYIKKHIKSHDADSQEHHICDICGKILKSRTYWVRHRATHSYNLPFKCSLCPYRGRFRESVKSHMKSHTGDKPYKCPQCPNRTFINSSNMKRHMLTHKGNQDFRYKCDICDKGFHERSILRDHLKVEHAGIRDHVCDMCGKAFGLRKQMMKHQVKVHKRAKQFPGGRLPLYVIAQKLEGGKNEENNLQEVEIVEPE